MKPIVRIIVASCLLLCLVVRAEGQTVAKSNAGALARIFGDSILSQNSRAVIRNARGMSDDAERYEYLSRWVAPDVGTIPLRLGGYFTTTNPIPRDGVAEPGAKIESPVMELIRVARRTNRLDELFRRISKIPELGNSQQRSKVAVLALIEIARGRVESAEKMSEAFYELISKSNVPMTERWPELLLLNISSQVPLLKDINTDILSVLRPARDRLRETPIGIHMQVAATRVEIGPSQQSSRWHPSTRASAASRGAGHPNCRWSFNDGEVKGWISHGVDFLHYQIPVTGDYNVEAEISTVPYENGVLFVGGKWISATGSAGRYEGDHRSTAGYKDFEPAMPNPATWSRYRTTVRDNQIVTVLNGREIDRREAKYAPWIGIRNNSGKRTTVRNLRITGQPTIPETIYPLLEGVQSWKSYQDDADRRWRTSDAHANGFMNGRRSAAVGFASIDSLSHYHRPIVEDGVIEYEFFYKEGETKAHPAIERLVFLVNPDGIRLRWIDDGIHDHSIDFRSSTDELDPVSGPIQLTDNAWNRVRLSFEGDEMQLAVNGNDAYSHKIVQPQRRLGLYFDANATDLRVRNMAWRGDWPKSLPPPLQQELAGKQLECLKGLDTWNEYATIRFNEPIDTARFAQPYDSANLALLQTGMRIEPSNAPGWQAHVLESTGRIFGDFDATLRFTDLTGYSNSGRSDLMLRFIDEHGNRYGTSRCFRPDNTRNVELKTLIVGNNNSKIWRSDGPGDETSNGTLRLVRRDGMIFSLIAHGDSDRFHLIASQKLQDPDSSMALSMELSRNNESKISAVLNELTIRTRPAGEEKLDPRVDVLQRIAKTYKSRFFHDFAKPTANDLVATHHATAMETGLQLKATQKPASVTCQAVAGGDFDVEVKLDDLALNPDSHLAMKLDVGDAPTQIELVVSPGVDEQFEVTARSSEGNGEVSDLGKFNLESVETLRLMRVQRTVFFVCEGKTESRLVGFADVGSGNIRAGSIQLDLDSESPLASVRLKSLRIRSSP